MPTRRAGPTPEDAALAHLTRAGLILAGVAGFAFATYHGYPGVLAIHLALLLIAWSEPRPVFSGAKDTYGSPTPLGAGEHRARRRYRLMALLRWSLIFPNRDWIPGPLDAGRPPGIFPWWLRAGWTVYQNLRALLFPFSYGVAFALLAAALSTMLPVYQKTWMLANAAAAFLVVLNVAAAFRRSTVSVFAKPAVRVSGVVSSLMLRPKATLGAGLTGLAGGLATAVLAGGFLLGPLPRWMLAACVGVVVMLAVTYPVERRVQLADWRDLDDTHEQWSPRWEVALGPRMKDNLPHLIGHRQVGALTVDTFAAPASLGATGLLAAKAKLTTALGSGMELAMLTTSNTDADGAPMPGSEHPVNVDLITYPGGQGTDVCDVATSKDEAAYAISAALSKAVDAYGGGGAQYALIDIEALHVAPEPDPETTWWARLRERRAAKAPSESVDDQVEGEKADRVVSTGAVWALRYGGSNTLHYARHQYAQMIPAHLGEGVTVLVNDWPEGDRAHPGGGRIYVGAIGRPGIEYADESSQQMLTDLAAEDAWNARWGGVLKTGANFPEPQFAVAKDAQLGRTQLHSLPFTIRQGEQVGDFEKLEPKLATTLSAAPFVSVVGYPGPGGRPGDRHPQAFAVRWSDGPVPPSADRLPPGEEVRLVRSTTGTSEHWVLAGQVNAAFDHARLARPEVISVLPLTNAGPRSGHIWKIEVRLHSGVTLTQVRAKMAQISSTLSVPWLQVTPADQPQCVVIVAGADFRTADLANSDRDLAYLADLEWQQAWADAKLVSPQGLIPTTLTSATLPTNEDVRSLDFELPSGITRSRVQGAVEKLRGSTCNEFIDVRPSPFGASAVRLLVSETDPMPFPAPIDFEFIDSPNSAGLLPFATSVEGEPVSWNISEDPHLLVVGASNSGKTAALQMLLYPMLVRGWDVHVADPIKAGGDFRFAERWLRSVTTTVEEASAMMDAVSSEVARRRSLNGKYGVGSYADLPSDVRPVHTVVVIDEFTSLILADKPRKPSIDETGAQAEYAEQVQRVALVENIGRRVGQIVREARSAGVTLVLATQRLTAKELDAVPGGNTIRTNMSRMILGKATFGERQSALRSPEDAPDLGDVVPKGRGLLETSGSPIQVVQSWYDHPIQEVLADQLSARVPAVPEKLDLSPFLPKAEVQAIEGQVLTSTRGDDGGPVSELGELNLADIELEDLDLGELDLSTGEDENLPPSAGTTTALAPRLPAVLLVTALDGAEVLGLPLAWVGPELTAPPDCLVLPCSTGQDALMGHPVLDALAPVLAAGDVEAIVWAGVPPGATDDLGARLDVALALIASPYGVDTLVTADLDPAAIDAFLSGLGEQDRLAVPAVEPGAAHAPGAGIEEFDFAPPPTGHDASMLSTAVPGRVSTGSEHLLGVNEEEFDF